MVDDIFFYLRGNISEFTDKYFFDYERQTVLLEVHVDYLDEIFKILKYDLLMLDITFVKELTPGITTVVASIPQLIDSTVDYLDEDSDDYVD
tara:strand:+ start:1206 stop:1481 length:276 start_codon:yes stop_codon:yes gene_type:complete